MPSLFVLGLSLNLFPRKEIWRKFASSHHCPPKIVPTNWPCILPEIRAPLFHWSSPTLFYFMFFSTFLFPLFLFSLNHFHCCFSSFLLSVRFLSKVSLSFFIVVLAIPLQYIAQPSLDQYNSLPVQLKKGSVQQFQFLKATTKDKWINYTPYFASHQLFKILGKNCV